MGAPHSKTDGTDNAEHSHRDDLRYNVRVTVDDANGNYACIINLKFMC